MSIQKNSTISSIEDALFFTADSSFDNQVYLSIKTGETYFISDLIDAEDEASLPEDLEESDEYILLPTKHDLDLGSRLVYSFAEEQMPNDYNKVRDIFSSSGAYGRFKSLLEYQDKLQAWYDYEEQVTRKEIIEWCKEEGITFEKPEA